jgi:hypothetical protein
LGAIVLTPFAMRPLPMTPVTTAARRKREQARRARPSVKLPALMAVLALAGCASTPPSRPSPPNLFISPSGAPYRASKAQAYPVADWFAQADRDHDGAMRRTEFDADADGFFGELDQNGDGVIDGAEVHRYETLLVPEIVAFSSPAGMGAMAAGAGKRPPGGGKGGKGRGGGGAMRGQMQAQAAAQMSEKVAEAQKRYMAAPKGAALFSVLGDPEPVRAADANLDWRVTREEWRAATKVRFKLLDANGDGSLSPGELPATPVQRLLAYQGGR